MKTLPIILIILVVIVLIIVVSVIVYAVRRRSVEMSEGLESGSRAPAVEATGGSPVDRTENLSRVLSLVRQRFEVSVSDVQDMLGFSRQASAAYLSELAAAGDIVQVGKTGRGEVYRIK